MPTRLPDPARSRAVLIGSGTVPAGFDLPRLATLTGLLTRLRARLAGTVEQPVAVANPRSVDKVRAAVRRAAAEATDLLLVYCAGYVQPDQDGRPRLVLAGSVPGELGTTAVSLDELTGYIVASPAAIKVLLLDCGGWTVAVPGTAILASGRSRAPRRTPTAFTEALLAALDSPDPPSFTRLRRRIDQELVRRDEPRAQAKAADVALVRGRGPASGLPASGLPVSDLPGEAVPDRPVPGEVRLGTDPAVVHSGERHAIAGIAAVDGLLGLGAVASMLWLPGSGQLLAGALGLVLFVGVLLLGGVVVGRKRPGATTVLLFDAVGTTLHRLAASPMHIPWSDVVTAGLLPPKACVGESGGPGHDHVFAVKLRPHVSRPVLTPLLVPKVDRLGYLGLAKIGDLGTTTHELLAELDQFAEDIAAHSNRDWSTRHPELRPLLG